MVIFRMKTIYVLWSYDVNEGEIRCIFWFIFRTRACRDERAMPALMYGGGARNRLHRNAPKVGIYTDVFIAVAAYLRRISVAPIARTAAVHQRRRGFRQL